MAALKDTVDVMIEMGTRFVRHAAGGILMQWLKCLEAAFMLIYRRPVWTRVLSSSVCEAAFRRAVNSTGAERGVSCSGLSLNLFYSVPQVETPENVRGSVCETTAG